MVERFALRPDSSEAGWARSWWLVSLVLAMSSILAPLDGRAGATRSSAGASVATTGRWSLPEPSTSPTTRNASTCQPASRARGRSGCRAARGRSVGQVPSPPAPPATAASRQRPRSPPSTPRPGEVVDGRVEVAGHDHVLAGALLGEPVEVAAPVAQLPPDRRDRVHGDDAWARRRSPGSATIDRQRVRVAGRPGHERRTSPRSRRGPGEIRIVVERALAISSNATRVHPHRAAALAHRDGDLLAERLGRLGQHDDVGALVEGEVGDRRGVGHLAEGVPAEHGDGCRVAGDIATPPMPRAARTATLPGREEREHHGHRDAERAGGAWEREERERERGDERARRGATRAARRRARRSTGSAARSACGHSRTSGDERRCRARRPSRGCGGAFHPP